MSQNANGLTGPDKFKTMISYSNVGQVMYSREKMELTWFTFIGAPAQVVKREAFYRVTKIYIVNILQLGMIIYQSTSDGHVIELACNIESLFCMQRRILTLFCSHKQCSSSLENRSFPRARTCTCIIELIKVRLAFLQYLNTLSS